MTTGAAESVLQLNVVPEPDPVRYPGVGGARRFVCPSRALAGVGSIREIEELDAVGTAIVGPGLGGRLQKFQPYRGRREVLIAVELDRLIALRNDMTVPRGFHQVLLCPQGGAGTLQARRLSVVPEQTPGTTTCGAATM